MSNRADRMRNRPQSGAKATAPPLTLGDGLISPTRSLTDHSLAGPPLWVCGRVHAQDGRGSSCIYMNR